MKSRYELEMHAMEKALWALLRLQLTCSDSEICTDAAAAVVIAIEANEFKFSFELERSCPHASIAARHIEEPPIAATTLSTATCGCAALLRRQSPSNHSAHTSQVSAMRRYRSQASRYTNVIANGAFELVLTYTSYSFPIFYFILRCVFCDLEERKKIYKNSERCAHSNSSLSSRNQSTFWIRSIDLISL